MTTKRLYYCNMCGESGGMKNYLVGIYHTWPDFYQRALHECENHICRRCLGGCAKVEAKIVADEAEEAAEKAATEVAPNIEEKK